MDDDVIEALADAFAEQLEYLHSSGNSRLAGVWMDSVMAVADVIHAFEETYDLRYFYRRAGYPEPYRVHEM